MAGRQTAVRPSITQEFLVSHYHVPHPGYPKFLVQVVDRVSGLRVDIFPDLAHSIEKARPISALDEWLRVLDAESILNHKLQTLSKASAACPVDEKHFIDALALAKLCSREVPPVPGTYLGKDDYCTDLDVRCQRCEVSQTSAFPLAPKRRIFDLLGYV